MDLAIIDAAYGVDTTDQSNILTKLQGKINQVMERQGILLLPVPAIGRGQELLVWLKETFPTTPVTIEQALLPGIKQMLDWPGWLRPQAALRIKDAFADSQVTVVKNATSRKRALSEGHGRIILTSDSMLQTKLSQWYFHQLKPAGRNCVLFTGHLAKDSFGHRLLISPQSADTCQVEMICYKVHQGLTDLRRILPDIASKHTVFVHSEKTACDALCRILTAEGYQGLYSLSPGDKIFF